MIVAIASLVAAAAFGLLLGPIAFAAGATVAALALVLPLLRRRPGGDVSTRAAVADRPPSEDIGGVISSDDPTFSEQPSRMVPRYRSVDADPTQSH